MDILNCCRICIQNNNNMRSIYEIDICGKMKIVDKIVICANITAKSGKNIPENICLKCLEDLHIAYRFKMNCETAETILKSIYDGQVITDLVMSSDTGEVFKYEPPSGLRVKRIMRGQIENQLQEITTIKSEVDLSVGAGHTSTIIEDDETIFLDAQNLVDDGGGGDGDDYIQQEEQDDRIDDNDDEQIQNEEYLNAAQQQMKIEYLENDQEVTQDFSQETITEYENVQSKEKIEQEENIIDDTNKMKPNSKKRKYKNKIVKEDNGKSNVKKSGFRGRKAQPDDLKSLKICEICGNTYKYKHALESHMRRHRNEKPFSCEICGKAFVSNFELRRHMRTHTGQKPYACQFCERRFSDFGSRIKHERTHTGERPYTCETCGKSFAYSHVLSSHVLIHTGEKRFGCDECGKRFTKSHHLKAHKNIHFKPLKNVWSEASPTTFLIDSRVINKNDDIMIQNNDDLINVLSSDDNQIKIEHPTTMIIDAEGKFITSDIQIIYN